MYKKNSLKRREMIKERTLKPKEGKKCTVIKNPGKYNRLPIMGDLSLGLNTKPL
jgi:hypothetical protein